MGLQWNTYPWIALARRTFEWEHPNVRVVYKQSEFGDPTGGLTSVDVAFLTPPFDNEHAYTTAVLAYDPRIAIVSSTHPWASRSSVSLADLVDQPLVTLKTNDITCRRFWELDAERGHSVAPSNPEPTTIDEWIAEIERGQAVAVAPSVAWATYSRPTLARIEVTDIVPAISAIGTAMPNDPLVHAFIEIVARIAAASGS